MRQRIDAADAEARRDHVRGQRGPSADLHGLRELPALDENLQPWWYGYSVGRWEGDDLVVETLGFRDDTWLDVQGSPLTGRARITERFRRPKFGTLQIDITIDDPTAYTKPFTVRVNQLLFVAAELIEFIGNENEKSVRYYDP